MRCKVNASSSKRTSGSFLFSFLTIILMGDCLADAASFWPLGEFALVARDVSNNGVVVGDGSRAFDQGYRWSITEGLIGLGELAPGLGSNAFGISADGKVIVGYASPNPSEAEVYRWTESTGMVGLGTVPSWYQWNFARGVSADGSVIGLEGLKMGGGREAAYWTEATGIVPIGDLPGGVEDSGVDAIAVRGSEILVFGDGHNDDGKRSFRWSSVSGMEVDPVGAVNDVSSDGSAIVGGVTSGYLLLGSTLIDISPDLDGPGFQGFQRIRGADGVSDDGMRVVGNGEYHGGSTHGEAFIYDQDAGLIRLRQLLLDANVDISEWSELYASEISPNGRYLVGQGIHNGEREAFMVELPEVLVAIPEPSTLVLAFIGCLGIGLCRIRRSFGRGLSGDSSA